MLLAVLTLHAALVLLLVRAEHQAHPGLRGLVPAAMPANTDTPIRLRPAWLSGPQHGGSDAGHEQTREPAGRVVAVAKGQEPVHPGCDTLLVRARSPAGGAVTSTSSYQDTATMAAIERIVGAYEAVTAVALNGQPVFRRALTAGQLPVPWATSFTASPRAPVSASASAVGGVHPPRVQTAAMGSRVSWARSSASAATKLKLKLPTLTADEAAARLRAAADGDADDVAAGGVGGGGGGGTSDITGGGGVISDGGDVTGDARAGAKPPAAAGATAAPPLPPPLFLFAVPAGVGQPAGGWAVAAVPSARPFLAYAPRWGRYYY